MLRSHQKVLAGPPAREITSGTFSPTLERSIARARARATAAAQSTRAASSSTRAS